MKKVKHPHRKSLIRQKYHKRKPKMTRGKCDIYYCCNCPLKHAFKINSDNCKFY